MGFAVVATLAIITAAGAVMLAAYLDDHRAAQGLKQQATSEQEARMEAARDEGFSIDSTSWAQGPKHLTIVATNTGAVTYNASDVEVVIDGEVRTSDIQTITVDNDPNRDAWTPLSELEIVVDDGGPSSPSRAMLVTGTGAKVLVEV